MKIDGFQVKVHGIVGFAILLVVFWAAYRVGQNKMLDNIPLFRGASS